MRPNQNKKLNEKVGLSKFQIPNIKLNLEKAFNLKPELIHLELCSNIIDAFL